MITIPTSVKIQGQTVAVIESPRGYVAVGNSVSDVGVFEKSEALKLKGEEHVQKWQGYMYQAFERALKAERSRINYRYTKDIAVCETLSHN